MQELDVYLFGMTCLSTIHILNSDYPKPDSYTEIKQTYILPSGETGNAALILANFGLKVKADGPYLGTRTKQATLDFYKKYKIDCSDMKYDPGFDGVEDLVLVDSYTRTIFGKFGDYLFNGEKKWSKPDLKAIKAAKVVSLDPFFGAESKTAAELCMDAGKKYVTIDLKYDDFINKNAAVSIISKEFTDREYKKIKTENLFKMYTKNTEGLIIFTFGNKEILYCRKGSGINKFKPYKVNVKGTLAAGDIFRAGIVYGVLHGWPDDKVVAFGAATAALACVNFPAALNPPPLKEIMDLVNS